MPSKTPLSPATLLADVERLVMGSVGVTAIAVADAAPELTLLQWRVLVVLAGSPDGLPVSEVATRIAARLPATSRLLSRMRARGLVEARKDQPDGRVTTLRLAPDGEILVARVVERRRQDLAAAIDAAALDRNEAATVERLASALARFL